MKQIYVKTCIVLWAFALTAYSQVFNPLTDPGLVVRLDDQSPFYKDSAATQVCADGDPCGYWGDLSGHGNHAKAHFNSNKPFYRADVLSGRAGLEWTQIGYQNLSLGNPAELSTIQGTNFTLFVVASIRSKTHGALLISKSTGGSHIYNIAAFNGQPQSYFNGTDGTQEPDNILFTFATTYDKNVTEVSGIARFYQNGTGRGSKIGTNTINSTNEIFIGDISTGISGTNTGTAGYSWEGKVFAVFMFNRTLSPAEVFQMDTYIRNRYNQTWPGSTSDKIVIWDGNSISMNDVIVKQVAAGLNVPPEAIFNLSWGSKDFKQMNKYAGQDVDSLIAHLPAGKKLISVGWEMTNELVTGSNATQAYQKMQTYATHVKQQGFKFVTGTTLPRCNNSSFDAARNSVNNMLRADVTTIDGLADVALNTLMGVDGTCPNTGYYGDGVHPTLKGDSVIAPYFIAAITSVSGLFPCPLPSTPDSISGKTTTRIETNRVYEISTVTGESYNWTITGGIITSGTGTGAINVYWTVPGMQVISVTAQNACGSSGIKTLSVSVITLSGIILPPITIPGFPPTTIGGADVLEVNPDILEFSTLANAQNVTVTSNVHWIVKNNAEWLTVEFDTDSVIGSISATDNMTIETRQTLITISGSGISKTILVTQESLSLLGANPTVPGGPGTITGVHTDVISEPLSIKPNPSVVNGLVSFNKPVNAIIYDLIGNVVTQIKNVSEFSLTGFRQGVYIIKTDRNEIRKLLVE